MASPVAGLRPMRAARLRTTRMPRPLRRMRAPFLRCLVTSPIVSSRIAFAALLVRPCFSASAAPSWRVLTVSTFGLAAFGAPVPAIAIVFLLLCESNECPILLHFRDATHAAQAENDDKYGVFCESHRIRSGRFRKPAIFGPQMKCVRRGRP